MFLLLCLPLLFRPPNPPACVVDQCDGATCTLELPLGTLVEVPRRRGMTEGGRVTCPASSN